MSSTHFQAERLSNQAAHSLNPDGTKAGQSYWTPETFGPATESHATIAVLPGGTTGVAVWARIQNPNNATTMAAYLGVYTNGTGWRLFKVTAGATFAQIGSTDATVAVAGDGIWLQCIGTTIRLFHFTGGLWVERCSGLDSAITAAGYIGMEFSIGSPNAGRLDDFGGGTITAAVGVSDYLTFPKAKLRTQRRVLV